MSNYKYTTTTVAGPPSYVLLKVDPPPGGYKDVHVIIPSDPPNVDLEGRISDADIWKQKHVTFVDTHGIKLHCFIKIKDNKYKPFDGKGAPRHLDAGRAAIWINLFKDQEVIDAIF